MLYYGNVDIAFYIWKHAASCNPKANNLLSGSGRQLQPEVQWVRIPAEGQLWQKSAAHPLVKELVQSGAHLKVFAEKPGHHREGINHFCFFYCD